MNKFNGLMTSLTCEWSTPQWLFDELNKEFNFQLDCCATFENAKCNNYFIKEDNGLLKDWVMYKSIWMNPPYGKEIKHWIKKAYDESLKGCTVVCLLPSRTDTSYWHDYVMKAYEIRFIRGRLKFGDSKNSAPFPSCIVIFKGDNNEKMDK